MICLAMAGFLGITNGAQSSSAKVARSAKSQALLRHEALRLRQGVKFYRHTAWRWQKLALKTPTNTEFLENRTSSLPLLRWTVRLWRRRSTQARRLATHPPNMDFWLCVHGGEGSWNDPATPYYGGLQMGDGFMDHYAPNLVTKRGTANHWSPLQQIWVAENALRLNHFSEAWLFTQWPNSSPPCVDKLTLGASF